jgi:hypothetical protein
VIGVLVSIVEYVLFPSLGTPLPSSLAQFLTSSIECWVRILPTRLSRNIGSEDIDVTFDDLVFVLDGGGSKD